MNIEMEQSAKQWIARRGNKLTIKLLEVSGCCAPDVQEVIAVPGAPKNECQFHEYFIDDIAIYVQRFIPVNQKIDLSLSGFSIFKSVSVSIRA